MLRRYLIVNGLSTALLGAAIWIFVPSTPGMIRSATSTLREFAMQSPVLGPLLDRIVMVSAR